MTQRMAELRKKYLEIFVLLYILRKQKKLKAYIESKPKFVLQSYFTTEIKNDIISWFWYIYPVLTIELEKRSRFEIIQSFLDG